MCLQRRVKRSFAVPLDSLPFVDRQKLAEQKVRGGPRPLALQARHQLATNGHFRHEQQLQYSLSVRHTIPNVA